jgi:hypothetical protein
MRKLNFGLRGNFSGAESTPIRRVLTGIAALRNQIQVAARVLDPGSDMQRKP